MNVLIHLFPLDSQLKLLAGPSAMALQGHSLTGNLYSWTCQMAISSACLVKLL
jgi:hypothetical protein